MASVSQINKKKWLHSLFNQMILCQDLFVPHQKSILDIFQDINNYLDNCEAGRQKGKKYPAYGMRSVPINKFQLKNLLNKWNNNPWRDRYGQRLMDSLFGDFYPELVNNMFEHFMGEAEYILNEYFEWYFKTEYSNLNTTNWTQILKDTPYDQLKTQ